MRPAEPRPGRGTRSLAAADARVGRETVAVGWGSLVSGRALEPGLLESSVPEIVVPTRDRRPAAPARPRSEGAARRSDPLGGRDEVLGGRYRLEERLGKGSAGAVYRARDLRLDRVVAVKVLLHTLDEVQRARFQREAELGASLAHPNLVRIYDAGTTSTGQPYTVMELVEGARPLHEAFAWASPRERLDILVSVAETIGFLHARGVVHRDIKCSNVLVDRSGKPMVCDFGLSWRQGMARLTRAGAAVGTPAYMSPEELWGDPPAPDPRRDVWALGVLLFRVLTGRYPFWASNPYDLAEVIKDAEPPLPSEQAPDIPLAVDAVFLRALEKDPADRYPDAAALAAALAEALTRPEAAPPTGRTPRRRRRRVGTGRRRAVVEQPEGFWAGLLRAFAALFGAGSSQPPGGPSRTRRRRRSSSRKGRVTDGVAAVC